VLEPVPHLEGIRNTWDSMPELRSRKDVDVNKFVDGRFVDDALKVLK
jgi:hypothetical protein